LWGASGAKLLAALWPVGVLVRDPVRLLLGEEWSPERSTCVFCGAWSECVFSEELPEESERL
jgi:hypothetical protein